MKKNFLCLLVLITLATVGTGCQNAKRKPFRSKGDLAQKQPLPGSEYEDRDIKVEQIKGSWKVVYSTAHLPVDRVSSEGTGNLELDFSKGEYLAEAEFSMKEQAKKTPTLALSEAGKVTFQEKSDLIRFVPDRTHDRTYTRVLSKELAEGLNRAGVKGYCGVSLWSDRGTWFAYQTQCSGSFRPSEYAHVESVTATSMVLEFCSSASSPKKDCWKVRYEK